MKKLLPFIPVLLSAGIFFSSCGNGKTLHVLQIECESPVAQCGNGPAIRFSGEKLGLWMEPSGKPGRFIRVPYSYILCCEYMPALIDSLKKAQALRQKSLEEKPGVTEKTYLLPDEKTKVHVYYNQHFIEDKEFSSMWFGEGPEAIVFYIDLKDFDKLLKDIEDRYRTCCLE